MYHAGYKQSLLEEIHREAFTESMTVLRVALRNEGGTPLDSLAMLISAHMEYVAARQNDITVVNENMRYLEPKALRRIEKLRNEWADIFRQVIDAAITSGDIRALDSGFMTRTLIGMFNSAARWYNPNGPLVSLRYGRDISATVRFRITDAYLTVVIRCARSGFRFCDSDSSRYSTTTASSSSA